MENVIVARLEEGEVTTCIGQVVQSASTWQDSLEALREFGTRLVSHCVAANDLSPINRASADLMEAGKEEAASKLVSWVNTIVEGVKRDRDTNTIAQTAKAKEAGLALSFTPEYQAAPRALLEQRKRSKSDKQVRVLKKSDIVALAKHANNGCEIALSDEDAKRASEAIRTLAEVFGLTATYTA